jgi:hypothetical protein
VSRQDPVLLRDESGNFVDILIGDAAVAYRRAVREACESATVGKPGVYQDKDSPLALVKITPTMELILEVLIARTRLGHHFWTFDRNSTSMSAFARLEKFGFVSWQNANTPGHVRAELTQAAKDYLLLPGYVPPILGGPK